MKCKMANLKFDGEGELLSSDDCGQKAIGLHEKTVPVCYNCAKEMEKEGFVIEPLKDQDQLESVIKRLLFNRYLQHQVPWRYDAPKIVDVHGGTVIQIIDDYEAKVIIEQMDILVKELAAEAEAMAQFDPPSESSSELTIDEYQTKAGGDGKLTLDEVEQRYKEVVDEER